MATKKDAEKTAGQLRSEELIYERKSIWETSDKKTLKKIQEFSNGYIDFLNKSKTERLAVEEGIKIAKESGFRPISTYKKLKEGDRVYFSNREKTLFLAIIGKAPISEGVNAVGAHIDSPRLDLKPNPLYEADGMALLKTHYYGGIKKYQWTTIPLAIHGVVVREDGTKLNVSIGEEDDEPVFCVTDLLPHLAREQASKPLREAITGEELNVLFGGIPYEDEKIKEKVKLNVLDILNKKYGMKERDFTSAELEIVPAFKAKSVGLDSSFVGGYGQDDRVCAYTALKAICDIGLCEKTAVCVLADKEEVGSMGNTGMESRAFEFFLADLMNLRGEFDEYSLKKTLANSKMLSADVDAGYDPTYASAMEKNNSCYLGNGVCVAKYSGHGGKSGGNDASAEFVGEVRKLFEDNDIAWQIGELGKVDQGGGGTIAYYLADQGLDVIDCGVAVLSMHAPFEITSKADVYMAYRAYNVFMK